MSLADELQRKPKPGEVPTAFEVLRQESSRRSDWQRARPVSPEEMKWYRVGYGMAPDYALNEPVSPRVPPAYRFFWALGLADATGGDKDRTQPAEEPEQTSLLPAVLGGLGTALGVSMLAWAALRRREP